MSRELALESKTFCSALWTGIYQAPNGDVSPCCVWNKPLGNVNGSSINEIYKSDRILTLKQKMLRGETLTECNYCNKLEQDTGDESTRDFFNRHFFDFIDFESTNDKFVYWDLRISNLCNFKCRMCSHGLSSEWYDDWQKIKGTTENKVIKIDDKSSFWDELIPHYDFVQSIYFAGGEPFLNEHHYRILQDLIDRELYDTKIIVNTNASITHWKKKKILDYYKKFNCIVFGFSIDGSNEVGEYIRKGLDYKKWKKTIKEYVNYIVKRNSKDITYVFQHAYGVTNFHNIYDYIVDLFKSDLVTNYTHFQFQPIMHPLEQSVTSLPPSVFNKFKEDIKNIPNIVSQYDLDEDILDRIQVQLNGIINYVENNPFRKNILNDFYQKQEKLDKLRNESIYNVIPDYRKQSINRDGKKLI
jgi:sulfatase maturation enzyme AslB (radical SAM superfamily)